MFRAAMVVVCDDRVDDANTVKISTFLISESYDRCHRADEHGRAYSLVCEHARCIQRSNILGIRKGDTARSLDSAL
jgi:hypothetical protein